MGFIGAKINDSEVLEWLKTKENQSLTIKEALSEKRLREINHVTEELTQKVSQFRLKKVIA